MLSTALCGNAAAEDGETLQVGPAGATVQPSCTLPVYPSCWSTTMLTRLGLTASAPTAVVAGINRKSGFAATVTGTEIWRMVPPETPEIVKLCSPGAVFAATATATVTFTETAAVGVMLAPGKNVHVIPGAPEQLKGIALLNGPAAVA